MGDGEPQSTMGEFDDVHDEVPGVRQLMERLVETLVSGGLDDVVLRPKNPHPQCKHPFAQELVHEAFKNSPTTQLP